MSGSLAFLEGTFNWFGNFANALNAKNTLWTKIVAHIAVAQLEFRIHLNSLQTINT